MRTKIEITVKNFPAAVISEDQKNWYVDLRTGNGEAIHPKVDWTLDDAINEQVNWKVE